MQVMRIVRRRNKGSSDMKFKPIPYYVDPPSLSSALIAEITQIIFGEPQSIQPCDLIFIFGGSHPGLWENGAQAYNQGLGQDIVVTGGYKPTALRHSSWQDGQKAEAEVIQRELIKLGVPEESIFIETKSTNTYENVRYALEVYNFEPVSSILAICKSYGVGCQTRTLQAQVDANVKIIPFPFDTQLGGDGPFITRSNWSNFPNGQAYMFANVLKMPQYGQAGHLVPLENMSSEHSTLVQNYFGT